MTGYYVTKKACCITSMHNKHMNVRTNFSIEVISNSEFLGDMMT